jgi:hypothetical protein
MKSKSILFLFLAVSFTACTSKSRQKHLDERNVYTINESSNASPVIIEPLFNENNWSAKTIKYEGKVYLVVKAPKGGLGIIEHVPVK